MLFRSVRTPAKERAPRPRTGSRPRKERHRYRGGTGVPGAGGRWSGVSFERGQGFHNVRPTQEHFPPGRTEGWKGGHFQSAGLVPSNLAADRRNRAGARVTSSAPSPAGTQKRAAMSAPPKASGITQTARRRSDESRVNQARIAPTQ